jgi:hypothetical protein
MLNRINPKVLAVIVLSIFGVIVVIGAIRIAGDYDWRRFDLDQERTVPATFSGLVLFLAVITALVLAWLERSLPILGMAAVLWWMGFDEVVAIHERLQDATGITWQILYLPFLPFVIWFFVRGIPSLPPPPRARQLFIWGIWAWIASQVLDVIQNKGGGELAIPALVPPEEYLEVTGSVLFTVALLLAVQARPVRGAEGAPTHEAPVA